MKRTHSISVIFALIGTIFYTGCAQKLEYRQSDSLQQRQVLKAAVLPFTWHTKQARPEGAELIRQLFTANLKQSNLAIMELTLVDALLAQNNLTDPDDITRLASKNPQRLGEILGTEVLITGHVSQWSKTYLVLHSDIEVEATISMINASSGETLMEVSKGEIRNAGLTRIPTGYVSAAIAPIKGLQTIFLYRLSQDLARNLAEPFLLTFKSTTVKPIIHTAAAVLKKAPHAQTLYVILIGDSGRRAHFSVDDIRNAPLTELHDGCYAGSYQGNFSNPSRINVTLVDFDQETNLSVNVAIANE